MVMKCCKVDPQWPLSCLSHSVLDQHSETGERKMYYNETKASTRTPTDWARHCCWFSAVYQADFRQLFNKHFVSITKDKLMNNMSVCRTNWKAPTRGCTDPISTILVHCEFQFAMRSAFSDFPTYFLIELWPITLSSELDLSGHSHAYIHATNRLLYMDHLSSGYITSHTSSILVKRLSETKTNLLMPLW